MSVNSKMTAIADPIRMLMGSTGKMGLDAMATNLSNAVNEVDNQNSLIEQIKASLTETEENIGITNNEISTQAELIQQIKDELTTTEENLGRTNTEINTQADLIQQIKTALEGKAAGGGVELPTLENPGSAEDLVEGMQLIDQDGNPVTGTMRVYYLTESDISPGLDGDGTFFLKRTANEKSYLDKESWWYIEADLLGDATADDVSEYATFTSKNGVKTPGNVKTVIDSDGYDAGYTFMNDNGTFFVLCDLPKKTLFYQNAEVQLRVEGSEFGNAKPSDVREGVVFTSKEGVAMTGTALIPGGGFVYPDGAFAPVANFTAGKQYALVAMIDGVRRYINTTAFNDWTLNATQITISEDAGDYVIFSNTPALFTAVASGSGFLLQNGTNYLNGRDSGGTNLVIDGTQMVWTVDTSATGGFSESVINAKEDANAVWLINTNGNNRYAIKYEANNASFGYDREGRDSTYSTGFTPFVLYEYVAGEGELNPVVDSSDANVTADKMLAGYSGYANGRKVDGNIQSRQAATITPSTTAQEIPAGVYLEGKQTISAIQTETKSVTENGTYTPSSGKYFSSFTVNVPSGGTSSAGLVVKSGTTTSATIATGLSEIEEFFIYKETQTGTGLIHLHYTKSATSRMYASAWSTQNYGTKTITNGTGGVTVNGGTLTISATQATQGALTSGVTYKWVAIGKE